MREQYIRHHFDDIKKYANVIENRLYDDCDIDELIQDNAQRLILCQKFGVDYIFIDDEYKMQEI